MGNEENKKLGEQLLDAGLITESQLQKALEEQEEVDDRLGKILLRKGLLGEKQLVEFLSQQTGYPVVNLDSYPIQNDALKHISETQARRYNVLPILKESNRLTVAMQDPLDIVAMDDLAQLTGFEIEPVISTARQIEEYIERCYGQQDVQKKDVPIVLQDQPKGSELEIGTDTKETARRPAVRIINRMLRDALDQGASNIHVNPKKNCLSIEFRIDSFIREYTELPGRLHQRIISRLQLMAEKSHETESEFGGYKIIRVKYGQEDVIFRMNRLTTRFGDKVMIKVCRGQNYERDLIDLGMDMPALTILENLLSAPRGLLIFTGPADSGTTTSLYASARYFADTPNSIVSVENPIEYELDFCTQVEVPVGKPRQQASAVYDALRTDPDILMVSEMGESHMARAALYAAATGRKVMSTYYADNAVDTLYHLAHTQQVDRYQLANSCIGVIAQRLVRLIDESCKVEDNPTRKKLKDSICRWIEPIIALRAPASRLVVIRE